MTAHPPLTAEEFAAVEAFAKKHGRNWKSELSNRWLHARTRGALQSLRNSHGPSWLHTFRLSKAKAAADALDARTLLEDWVAAYCPADGSPLSWESLNYVHEQTRSFLGLPAPDAAQIGDQAQNAPTYQRN